MIAVLLLSFQAGGRFCSGAGEKYKINSTVISRKNFNSIDEYDQALIRHMRNHKVQLVVLAGFLSLLGERFVQEYKNSIINVHPSLIPSFCGKGYYGIIPHQKALEYGVKITGATVHFVEPEYDSGPIILQKAIEVLPDDTPKHCRRELWSNASGSSFLKRYVYSLRGDFRLKDGKLLSGSLVPGILK